MTYFQIIEQIDNIKNSPIDENLLNTLNSCKTKFDDNTMYHIITHLNDLIKTRIQKSLYSILNDLNHIISDSNLLSLKIIELKKELKYANKLINIEFIPIENKEQFKKTLQHYTDELDEVLTSSIENIDTNGELMLILKNSNINKLED